MSDPTLINAVLTSSSSKEPELSYYEQIIRMVQGSSEALSQQRALIKPKAKTKPTVARVSPKKHITESDFDDSEASTASDSGRPQKKTRTEELNIEFGAPARSTSTDPDKSPRQIIITDKAICEYIRRCVYDFQHFGGTKHKELWRQLGVELGHRVFDVAKIGVPALEDANSGGEGETSNKPLAEPYFTYAQDAKIVSYVAESVGNGVGIWEILAQEFRCTTFFVMRRWCQVLPKIKQHQLITLGVNRRCSRELRQVGEAGLTPFHDTTTVIIAEQVKIYNNTNTTRTVKQFWRVIAAYLNKNNLISTTFTKTDEVYKRSEVQKCYDELCFTYPGSSTIVPCQPLCISNINAVVYLASAYTSLVMDSNLRDAVHKWWYRHLYHNVRDVYDAYNKYRAWQQTTLPVSNNTTSLTTNAQVNTTTLNKDNTVYEVECVLRTVLFVVVLSTSTDTLVESTLPASNTIPSTKSAEAIVEGTAPTTGSYITTLQASLLPPVLLPLPLLQNANINLPPLHTLTRESPIALPTQSDLSTASLPLAELKVMLQPTETSVQSNEEDNSGALRWSILAEVCVKASIVEVKKRSKAPKHHKKSCGNELQTKDNYW